MEYQQDIFYDIKHLSIDDLKNMFYDAKKKSYNWHIDKLDYKTSWSRQVQKYARFDSMLKKLDNTCHVVFIHRRRYKQLKGKRIFGEYCIEIGFSTMTGVSWYLFINVSEKHLDYFIEKYKLKTKN